MTKFVDNRVNTSIYAINTARWFNGETLCDPLREVQFYFYHNTTHLFFHDMVYKTDNIKT